MNYANMPERGKKTLHAISLEIAESAFPRNWVLSASIRVAKRTYT